MKELEEKCWHFVLHHYQQGRFDTAAALRKVKGECIPPSRTSLSGWYRLAGVAALLALCVGTYLYFTRTASQWVRLTASATVEQFLLPDSTCVTLSPHASLTYDASRYGKPDRNVQMSGRIFFSVRHDEQAPFCVQAGDAATVRVLGTQFEVRESADSTAVYVTSGRVRFAARDDAEGGLILTRGMAAVLTPGSDTPTLRTSATPNPSAWALGTFVYEDTPIPVVLDELSAYFGVRLMASDPSKRLSAEFDADRLEDILALIEQTLEITITEH
jgi:ferric-dicitrate binding protein FerR (iron transport regulator)